jgi:hypothetical protein
MIEDNGSRFKILASPGEMEFCYVDSHGQQQQFVVDVVDAKLMLEDIQKRVPSDTSEQLGELRDWAAKCGHQLRGHQLLQLQLGIMQGWIEFKKKLPPSLASLITTSSTRRSSSPTPITRSAETSTESSRKTNSGSDESVDASRQTTFTS